ncbi:MAG TPA: mitochondrial fission ELM1 family protein [Afifellaceae bacterium]|nr:mitochondrial fission ELM1 family protein [Afifellaceae bacterium]
MLASPACWVLTTGEAGMRSQAVGLAEAVGLPFVEKRIRLKAPWSWLPGHLAPAALSGLDSSHDRLSPPWPRLVISCGRRSVAAAIAVRRASAGRTIGVHIQDPRVPARHFDLVVAMRHDGLAGDNVVSVDTALHRVSRDRLVAAGPEWRTRLKPGGAPLLGVLLGGRNRHYRWTPAILDRLAAVLRRAHSEQGMRVFVTPSRRTEPQIAAELAARFAGEPWFSIWDETDPNPYFGILSLADRLVVTGESVSMISECLATGSPVHVLPLAGRGRRHEAFLDGLVERRLASLAVADDLDWGWDGAAPVDATPVAAERVHRLLAAAPVGR